MKKTSLTNKITPCCGLPFSVIYWWVSNLTLNSEADRQFILSKISQNGIISIDAWKVLINSGTLEADASLSKAEFLAWFDCRKQPSCEQLKIIIEGYKVGNWTPETELPSNLALIDFEGKNGNVFTKEQINELISITQTIDFGGDLLISDTPNSIIKKWWFAKEIGTYINAGNIVTLEKMINIIINDGISFSLYSIPIDFENFLTGNIQSVGVVAYGQEDNLATGIDYICNLPEDKMTEDRYLQTVELNLKNSGKIVFSILNHNATNNTISLDRNFEFDFVDGYNKFEFFNEKILQGQIFAINRILSIGSNAKLYFSGNSGQMLTQYKNDGTIKGQLADTVYNYKLTTSKNYTDNLIELISSNFAIKSEIADLKIPFKLENESSYGSTEYDFPFGELTQSELYLEKLNFSNKKYIKNIKMYAQTAGSITFVFGLIDQHNIFIPRKEFTFSTVANQINTYDFNDILIENEAVAVKLPSYGMTWQSTSAGAGKLWFSSYGGVLSAQKDFNMAWLISMADYVENTIAFKSEIEPLKNDIILLQNKPLTLISPNGTPYKLAVDNLGNLTAKSQIFGKIAHLGNSICKHEITSFWWGFWGMAATVRENDYVHRFLAKYQTINASATTDALNIANWEINHTTYNKTNIDSTIDGSDLIVVRIGENVTYSASFKYEFRNLINYIIAKEPQATILIGGTFWYSAEKDTDMKAVADELGITFVSMQGLNTPSNRATLSTQVYGDDNQWHTISDGGSIAQGVADHPSDAGMEAIAQRLFNGLGL